MLPTEDALWVGAELARRFGVPRWQFALTATDANRFAIRLARHVTGRPKVLVFNWCYHGTVDETFATLVDGVVGPRRGNLGPPVRSARDDEGGRVQRRGGVSRRRSPHGDVALVLTEPALTNVGIVHARARLPRRAPRPHPRDRHAARDRRDAHDLLRAGRLHGGARARARHRHDRQADRRRRPRGGVRLHGRAGRTGSPRRSSSRTSTSAASAARSRPTRCRSPPCERRSLTSSPRRRSRG